MTREEIKNFREKSKNQTLGGHEVQRLIEMYARKYRMTQDEARDEVQKAHPRIWSAYTLGTPLPSGQQAKIYEI